MSAFATVDIHSSGHWAWGRKAGPRHRMQSRGDTYPVAKRAGPHPEKNWDGALSLLAHAALIAVLTVLAGLPVLFFAFLLPFTVALAAGAYLFFAQRNFKGMRIVPLEEWTHYRGALESSSCMKLSPVMKWFTGNIGYDHVHHLNSLIPFYRLPEAMAAIPELQEPTVTSLHPRDILKATSILVVCRRSRLSESCADRAGCDG